MLKKRKDGTTYYYYYKKKVGRHKKKGRKKKLPEKIKKPMGPQWKYKIIRCIKHKQRSVLYKFHTIEEVNDAIVILQEQNNKVLLPKKYTNNCKMGKVLSPYISEYVILQKIENDQTETFLRNEYGKYVKHTTNSDKWKIYDKIPCLVEETFWVYGYHQRNERKTISQIIDELIEPYTYESFVRISLYQNKLLIRYDNDFNLVIGKNLSETMRLYNKLEELLKKDKNIIFTGKAAKYSDNANMLALMIKDKTGWSDCKIFQSSTRK